MTPTASSKLTAEQVYTFARNQLASYKALDGGVIFVEEIPRTASGKIQRFKLSQMNSYRLMMESFLRGFEGAGSSFVLAGQNDGNGKEDADFESGIIRDCQESRAGVGGGVEGVPVRVRVQDGVQLEAVG